MCMCVALGCRFFALLQLPTQLPKSLAIKILFAVSAKAAATLTKITQSALALLHHSPLHLSRLVQLLCQGKVVGAKADTTARDKRIAQVVIQQVFQHCIRHVVSAQESASGDLELLELLYAMRQAATAIKLAGELTQPFPTRFRTVVTFPFLV